MALTRISYLVIIPLMVSTSSLWASQLWGGRGGPWLIDQVNGALITQSTVSDVGFWYDSASDPLRSPNVIWGVANPNRLQAVDPVQGLLLSSIDLELGAGAGTIQSLAISPRTGMFYGTSNDSLYSIDPNNGDTTLVGTTSSSLEKALGFDSSGVLFGITNANELVKVSTLDATMEPVATLNVFRAEDIAVRPEDGLMYSLAYTTESYQLITIDTQTGATQLLGPSFVRPTHLAFTGVPEPCGLALVSLGGLIGFFSRLRC